MHIARILQILLVAFPFIADDYIVQTEDMDPKTELQQIDKEIEDLKELKNRYKASETRHNNDALRWQFQQNQKQESRRAYQQAELDKETQKQIQGRIDKLELRKSELLKE